MVLQLVLWQRSWRPVASGSFQPSLAGCYGSISCPSFFVFTATVQGVSVAGVVLERQRVRQAGQSCRQAGGLGGEGGEGGNACSPPFASSDQLLVFHSLV